MELETPTGTRRFNITQVHRHPEEGYWMARVGAVQHDRKHGSWRIVINLANGEQKIREALPQVAAKLQEVVRRLEKGERVAEQEMTVAWPTGERLTPRFSRNGKEIGSVPPRPSRPAPTPAPLGPAEAAMERLSRKD